MKGPLARFILFVVVFIGIMFVPWWLSLAVLVTMTLYLPFYFEVLFFGFLFDTLYSAQYSFPYTFLSLAFIFLVIVMFVKERIRT